MATTTATATATATTTTTTMTTMTTTTTTMLATNKRQQKERRRDAQTRPARSNSLQRMLELEKQCVVSGLSFCIVFPLPNPFLSCPARPVCFVLFCLFLSPGPTRFACLQFITFFPSIDLRSSRFPYRYPQSPSIPSKNPNTPVRPSFQPRKAKPGRPGHHGIDACIWLVVSKRMEHLGQHRLSHHDMIIRSAHAPPSPCHVCLPMLDLANWPHHFHHSSHSVPKC